MVEHYKNGRKLNARKKKKLAIAGRKVNAPKWDGSESNQSAYRIQ